MPGKKHTIKDKIKRAPPPTLEEPELDGIKSPDYDNELPDDLLRTPQSDSESDTDEPPQELHDLEELQHDVDTDVVNSNNNFDNSNFDNNSNANVDNSDNNITTFGNDSLEINVDDEQYVYAPRELPLWDPAIVMKGMDNDSLLHFLEKYKKVPLFDRIAGMIYGCALGECLGLQSTGLTPSQIQNKFKEVQELTDKPVFGVPAYSWYGNTDQLILTIQHLTLNNNTFDVNDFARTLVGWRHHGIKELGELTGLGVDKHTMKVTSIKSYLEDPIKASQTKTKSYSGRSNSALVRTLPCAVIPNFTTSTINCTALTHANSVSVYASWALCTICRSLWQGNLPLVSNIVRARMQFIKQRKTEFNIYRRIYMCEDDDHDAKSDVILDNQLLNLRLDDLTDPSYVLKTLGCGIYALNAIKCVTNNSSYLTRDNIFKEIQINIANQGGDAVTNTCVSGAVLGSWLGYSKLPKDWLYRLKNKTWLDQQIMNFLKTI